MQDTILYSFGSNSFGELGTGCKRDAFQPEIVQGIEGEQIVKIAAGHHSAAINLKGELFVWGSGIFGEFLLPTRFAKIDA